MHVESAHMHCVTGGTCKRGLCRLREDAERDELRQCTFAPVVNHFPRPDGQQVCVRGRAARAEGAPVSPGPHVLPVQTIQAVHGLSGFLQRKVRASGLRALLRRLPLTDRRHTRWWQQHGACLTR